MKLIDSLFLLVVYFMVMKVELFVSSLTSVHTGMSLDYYSLPFCRPGRKNMKKENIGEGVSGDKVGKSVYKVTFSFVYFQLECIYHNMNCGC